jgi:S-methylmethionine-dependent homocysteine/selenocysteine methylase
MLDLKPDHLYLAEGGTETEIMFRHGFEFPHFAVFELLKNAQAVSVLKDMYRRYLDVVAETGSCALMGGLDYRASPDWAGLLGYSRDGLFDVQAQCIDFLRNVAAPYRDQIPEIVIVGNIGPRGDAYALNTEITAEIAEEYHLVQLENLKQLDVDMAWGATINNVPEAVGLSRAAAKIGMPLNLSFTLTSDHVLRAGPTLKDAIEATDALAGDAKPMSYGVNCSHPLELAPALEQGNWFDRVQSFRPNAAMMDKIALCKLNHLEDGDPVELGQQLGDMARTYPHINIWGACCGCWDTHLREIVQNVREVWQSG